MAVVANYPKLSTDWLRHEADARLNRKQAKILSGTGNLSTGAVLGRITAAGASSAAKAGGNTGGGTLTLDGVTPVLPDVVPGVYAVRCVALVANGGLFEVRHSVDGLLGTYSIGGAAWARGVKFAMADVGTDFALGDGFDITVAAGSGKLAYYSPVAVNGCAKPYGILLDARDASIADADCVVVTGHAEIVALGLEWGAAVDDANKKAAGVALLERLGFRARQAA